MSKAEEILDSNYWTTDKNFNENIKPSILLAMKEIAELNFRAGEKYQIECQESENSYNPVNGFQKPNKGIDKETFINNLFKD